MQTIIFQNHCIKSKLDYTQNTLTIFHNVKFNQYFSYEKIFVEDTH